MHPALELLRPATSALSALAVLVAAVIAIGPAVAQFALPIALAVAAGGLFTAAGCALNDYLDRESDKSNHPARPIPAGKIEPGAALLLSGAAFAAAILAAALINLVCLGIVLAALAVQLGYEFFFKKAGLSGNLTIGVQTALLYVFGGWAVGGSLAIVSLSMLSLLAVTGREIIKDIEDVKGDTDRATLPRRVGAKKSALIAAALLLLAVLLSGLPYWPLQLIGRAYIPIIIVADAAFIYAAVLQLKSPKTAQKVIKAGMFTALLAFLAGRLI
jgi:geranylgeranylglycerol-phosphate geranylgeranyltransferase